MKTYTLFEGRHELPSNEGAIFSSFDFDTKKGVETPLYWEAMSASIKGGIKLIVTGLTPALTQFLRSVKLSAVNSHDCNEEDDTSANVTLLHYDRETNSYWEQAF